MKKKSETKALSAADMRTLPALQEQLSALFPSIHSLNWELRQHRSRYVEAGALFEIGGRLVAHPAKFEATAMQIGAERAAERTRARAPGANG